MNTDNRIKINKSDIMESFASVYCKDYTKRVLLSLIFIIFFFTKSLSAFGGKSELNKTKSQLKKKLTKDKGRQIYDPCEEDVRKFCSNFLDNEAAKVECLKENSDKISNACLETISRIEYQDNFCAKEIKFCKKKIAKNKNKTINGCLAILFRRDELSAECRSLFLSSVCTATSERNICNIYSQKIKSSNYKNSRYFICLKNIKESQECKQGKIKLVSLFKKRNSLKKL
jgi:hypothetical protein